LLPRARVWGPPNEPRVPFALAPCDKLLGSLPLLQALVGKLSVAMARARGARRCLLAFLLRPAPAPADPAALPVSLEALAQALDATPAGAQAAGAAAAVAAAAPPLLSPPRQLQVCGRKRGRWEEAEAGAEDGGGLRPEAQPFVGMDGGAAGPAGAPWQPSSPAAGAAGTAGTAAGAPEPGPSQLALQASAHVAGHLTPKPFSG
jgi:hypothetical protein